MRPGEPGARRPLLPDFPLAIIVVTVAAIARFVIAANVPLVPDETYYWEWSRRLASGYFDHPGAIAYLIRAGTALVGVTPLGIRLGAVLAGWGTSICLVLLTRRLAGSNAALRAAVIISCMPLAAAGLVLATPDAPLLLATAVTVLLLDHAVAAPAGSLRSLGWWLAAGLALGAALDSKYNAVLLPLAVFIALLVYASLRRHLATPGPYLAALLALLIFSPVIAWNASHDWISFRFQLSHGLGPAHGSALLREASLIGGQLGLVSPILFALLAIAVCRALARGTAREAILGVLAATAFLFFCVTALSRPAEPNWQAVAYIPATAVLAAYRGGRVWRRWLGAACALGATISVVVYLQATSPFLPVSVRNDPTARGAGWSTLSRNIGEVSNTGVRTWIAGNRYQDASEMAFHLPGHPITFSLNIASRPNQYDLWPSFASRAQPGDDLVLVLPVPPECEPDTVIETLRPHFRRTRLSSTVRLAEGAHLVRNVWVLEGWNNRVQEAGFRGQELQRAGMRNEE